MPTYSRQKRARPGKRIEHALRHVSKWEARGERWGSTALAKALSISASHACHILKRIRPHVSRPDLILEIRPRRPKPLESTPAQISEG